jgi:CelD/BcsL family acetyltransferase involved in cellulose biosynthesis
MSEAARAIEVSITPSPLDIGREWHDLTRRAPPNVFMNPAGLNAIHETGYARTHVLLAWDRSGDDKKLVGIWALEERTIPPLAIRFLTAPPHFYAFVASPVIDPAYTDAVVRAFFAAIAADPALPKVVRVKYLDGAFDSCRALRTAAGARQRLTLSERPRAFITREAGAKRSGATRKKMRQDWNRLAALGAVAVVNDRAPGAAADAFEVFLALEAQGWKGANRTALLSDAADAAFARRMFAKLAEDGAASVALLTLDGTAIAAQVVLYCGTMAYTWKTAYDAAYGKHSPGALLVDKLSEALFAGGAVDAIESCSPEGGFMASLWTARRPTVDLLIDLGSRSSFAFTALAAGVRGYAAAKEARNRLRQWRAARRTGTKPAAA